MKKRILMSAVLFFSAASAQKLQLFKELSSDQQRQMVASALPDATNDAIKDVTQGFDRTLFPLTRKTLQACKPQLYGKASGIGFTIQNKGKRPIWIGIVNNGYVMMRSRKLLPAQEGVPGRFIDISKKSTILIWTKDPGVVSYEKGIKALTPTQRVDVDSGKTIYVVWNGMALVPVSAASGCSEMDSLGLSLAKNAAKGELKVTKFKVKKAQPKTGKAKTSPAKKSLSKKSKKSTAPKKKVTKKKKSA